MGSRPMREKRARQTEKKAGKRGASPLERLKAAAGKVGRHRFSRRAQRAATVLTGMVLTVGCCLLAERYAVGGPQAVQTGAEPAEGMAVLILDYHQVLPTAEDLQKAREAGESGILLADFKEDLAWLTEQGAHFVLPADLKRAAQGLSDLPEKAVMLTFDGGYESFYTIVWPQLREQSARGTVAVSGAEAGLYSGSVEKELASSRLSWNQLAQMDRSDAVEISSAGYGLAGELDGYRRQAPMGQLQNFLSFLGFGEGDAEVLSDEGVAFYRSHLAEDAAMMSEKFRENLYHEPDAYVVPAGCEGEETDAVLKELGFSVTVTEGQPLEKLDSPFNFITGRDSLYSLKRVARGEEGTLREMLEGIF